MSLGTAVVDIRADTRGFERSLTQSLGGIAGTVGKVVGGIALAVTGIGTAVAGIAIKGGLDRVLKTEAAIVQMRRLGIATEDIDELVRQVDETFDGTVFTNPEGFALTQRLLGAGEELDAIPARLQTIADFAAHGNVPLDQMGNIFERIIGQGRVTAEELNRLSDANVPLSALAEALGLSIPELRALTKEGEFTADMFLEAATNAEMFQGAAQAAGDTTAGAWQNVRSQLARLGEQLVGPLFGEDGPMVGLMKALRQALIDIRPWFEKAGQALGNWLIPQIEALSAWLTSGGLPDLLSRLQDRVREVVGRFGSFGEVFERVKGWISDFAGEGGLGKLKDSLFLLGGPLLLIAQELFPLIKPLLDAIIPPLAQIANDLAPVLAAALGFLADEILPGLVTMLEAVIGWVIDNKGLVVALGIAGVAFQVFSAIVAINPFVLLAAAIVGIVALIITNWDSIKAFIARTWESIKNVTATVWEAIKGAVKAAAEFIVGLFLNFTLPGLLIKHWDTIKEGVEALADFIKEVWDGIVGFFGEMPGRISRAVGNLWEGLKTAFRNAVNWIIKKWNDFRLSITLPSILGGGTIAIDTPNIPLFDAGGIFRAATRGGHGLAILKDRETVLPPGVKPTMTTWAPVFHIQVGAGATRQDAVMIGDEVERRLRRLAQARTAS